MKLLGIEFYDIDDEIVFIFEDVEHDKVADFQIAYLKDERNAEDISKFISIFRELNDSRFDDHTDKQILDILIEGLESGEFLYTYGE